jgi:hypothetical protein
MRSVSRSPLGSSPYQVYYQVFMVKAEIRLTQAVSQFEAEPLEPAENNLPYL